MARALPLSPLATTSGPTDGGGITSSRMTTTQEMFEKFSRKARKMKRGAVGKRTFSQGTADGSRLSDDTKQSLTSVLSVLGVSHRDVMHHGEKHRIFVLGLDAEDLRAVTLPPSTRKCEELPWHLSKCYRWHTLKSTLVDLRTFEVVPFDVVSEYNYAIEGWQALSRPTISQLGEMVHVVGDFMREMSQLVQKEYASPPFLHMTLEYKDLEGVGIAYDLFALAAESSALASSEHPPEEKRLRGKSANLAKPKPGPTGKLPHYRGAPCYYYQFPWMALSGSEDRTVQSAAATTLTSSRSSGSTSNSASSTEQDSMEDPQVVKSRRFWTIKRVDPFGEPSVNVSDDRLRSRLKAGLGRSATTTLLDTRSHSSFLDDVCAGMVSRASSRRHATRVEMQEAFGTTLPSKRARTLRSTASAGTLSPVRSRGPGGRGGFLSEEDSDMNSTLTTSADLRTLGFGRCGLAMGTDILLRREDSGGNVDGSRGEHALGRSAQKLRKKLRYPKPRGGLTDARKVISTLAGTGALSPLPGKALIEANSFLGTRTTIFSMTVDEEMVLEAKDMVFKLRHIHDALLSEAKGKTTKLLGMQRDVEARNSQDNYTMSHIVVGEHMLKALETRLLKVQSTTDELERVSAFYDRIIELCVKNPPKNDCHLRSLQEQVFLTKQQSKDLSRKLRELLLEKDSIECLGIDFLRAQLMRTKAVRRKVNTRIKQLREKIQKYLKPERRGLHLREGSSTLSDSLYPRNMKHVTREATSMRAEGANILLAINSRSGEGYCAHECFEQDTTKENGEQEGLEQLAKLVGADGVDNIAAKFKYVQTRTEGLCAQKQTASLAAERLRMELEECQKLILDREVMEDEDMGEASVSKDAASNDKTIFLPISNPSLYRKQRRLDDLLFQSDTRQAQARRKVDKASKDFNYLKVGILHLAKVIDNVVRRNDDEGIIIPVRGRVLQLQEKALQEKLPVVPEVMEPVATTAEEHDPARETDAIVPTPFFESATDGVAGAGCAGLQEDDEDHLESNHEGAMQIGGSGLVESFNIDHEENVFKLLEACEERVCSVMEICGISVDGDLTATKIESMAESPGSAQHVFWHSGLSAAAADPLGGEPITEGPGTPSTLHRLFMGHMKGLKHDGSGMDIRVLPSKAGHSRFERNAAETLMQQNETLQTEETEATSVVRKNMATGLALFLEKTLSTNPANKHLRRANMMVMGKQGKRAGFGLVMDDILSGADIDIYGVADEAKKQANGSGSTLCMEGGPIISQSDLSLVVKERPDLKASAQAVSSRRKQGGRKKA